MEEEPIHMVSSNWYIRDGAWLTEGRENVAIVPGGRAGLIRIAAVLGNCYLGFFIPHRAPSLRLQRLRDHERERHLEALFGYRRRHVLGHVVRFWGWEELDLKVLVNG